MSPMRLLVFLVVIKSNYGYDNSSSNSNQPNSLRNTSVVEEWATHLLNFDHPTGNLTVKSRRSVCRISEFSCAGATKCVSSDKFCDGVDDCGDRSDEPTLCTPCNRTYYGEWGNTYQLSINSLTIATALESNKRHFVCQLTFAAAGDSFGDFVQIMFDSINIGPFVSSIHNGCPEGSLQVAEISRPMTGGHWCGSGSGYSVYFSEMTAIALTLNVNRNITNANVVVHKKTDTTVITSEKQMLEFDFKMRYKFIPRSLAVVRYGPSTNPTERGELVPGTYCSRVLDNCHRQRCKIQSPNYPGIYPRNISCYYTVYHRETPPCKRVLIQINQNKPHKVQLRSIGKSNENNENFLAWEDCDGNKDYLIVYDGKTTDDDVLLKICGGNYIPPITSSSNEVLIAFHATPYGNLLEPKPPAPFPVPLRGFELDVDIVIVDSESADYNNNFNCSFFFISNKNGEPNQFKAQEYGGNWITGKTGTVSSPRHTIPPNTTCRYEFVGNKHEAIWVYFVSYRRELIKDSKEFQGNCTTKLQVKENFMNEVLLGSYCDNELPKLCDHKALQNETRMVRACTANESYISAGSKMIIEQAFLEGTALRPLHYQFNYEFVRRHPGTDGSCNRKFSKLKQKGVIRTSDNVFDFGRGGNKNLKCIYEIKLNAYESINIKVGNSSFGERNCRTITDHETGRYICSYNNTDKSEVRIAEFIWPGSNITSNGHCICNNASTFNFHFLGRKVEIIFEIQNMTNADSYENFFAHFNYEIKKDGCRADNHYLKTESGLISLESKYNNDLNCEHYPWLIEAKENYSLYLRIPGFIIEDKNVTRICPTKNRIMITNSNLVYRICPASNNNLSKKPSQTVEIYSDDFLKYTSPLYPNVNTQFYIDFIGKELGTYRIKFLEVLSTKSHIVRATEPIFAEKLNTTNVTVCEFYCPELTACISEKLWCDGEVHCPISLADEKKCDSFWLTLSQLMSPAVYIPLIAAVVSAILCCLLVFLCLYVKRAVVGGEVKDYSSAASTVERLPPRDYDDIS